MFDFCEIFLPSTDINLKTGLETNEKPEASPVTDIFGTNITSINKCTRCFHQVEKDITSLTLNLSFHESANGKIGVFVKNMINLGACVD